MTRHDACVIDPTAQIAPTAVVGSPFRPLLDGRQVSADRDTVIGAGVWVGQFAAIGRGVRIGVNSLVEDYVSIQAASTIGERVVVASRSWVGIGATVGDDSVIKGHIGDSARIGRGCRIAGDLIHRQLDPSLGWDDPESAEPAPVVGDGAFVGWRALVVGGVNIGAGSYVCAGALVTRDVPAGHIASDRNRITHPGDWPGALGKSPFFARPA
ncbi:MAG TPA: DapH/DapD/GlmU-related protein [Streptosporangiaceae bacterium]|nr:DapH/DapD/GlmU-related protein [Streptosporangiaceae bacterium]